MSTPTILFDKNKNLFDENLSTGIEFSSDVDKEFLNAIKLNAPISSLDFENGITISDGTISAEGDQKKFEFKNDSSISIDGSASAGLRFGIYRTKSQIEDSLKSIDKIEVDVADIQTDQVYCMFSFSYELKAGAKGKWIFGAGDVSLGGKGERQKKFVVLRIENVVTGLKTALQSTIDLIKPPKAINDISDLSKNSTILIQVEGEISGKIGASVGYDYNWVYESNTKGLEGAVGLKAKLGATIDAGFNASGQYAVQISRKEKAEMRLKLYKQRKKGWSFALGLSAAIQADISDFDELSFDEFAKATLGIHHSQIFQVLKKINEFSDFDELPEKLFGMTETEFRKLFGAQVSESFDEIKERALQLIEKWEQLDEKSDEAVAVLWKLMDQNTGINLSELRNDISLFAQAEGEELKELMTNTLSEIDYFRTDIGKLLIAISDNSVLDILVNSDLLRRFQNKAKSLEEFLALDEILSTFHSELSEILKIEKIKGILVNGDDGWLKGRLEEFIGEALSNEKLEEIVKFINKFSDENTRNQFFEKLKEALQNEYGASFGYQYQKTKTKSALIDINLNYEQLNGDQQQELNKKLNQVWAGDFNNILIEKTNGLKLNLGTLTHQVEREKNIEVTLPFLKRNINQINNTLGSAEFMDVDGGRIAIYNLKSSARLEKNRRISEYAIAGKYQFLLDNQGLVVKPSSSFTTNYNFFYVKKKARTNVIENNLFPFVNEYLPKSFGKYDDELDNGFDDWLDGLAYSIDLKEANGPKRFGNVLINLKLSIPSNSVTDWFNAPDDIEDEAFDDLAIDFQHELKRIVELYFFQDEDNIDLGKDGRDFENPDNFLRKRLDAILVYISLPNIYDPVIKRNGKFKKHWNYDRLADTLKQGSVIIELSKNMAKAYAIMSHHSNSRIQGYAEYYKPSQHVVNTLISRVLYTPTLAYVKRFLRVERDLVVNSIVAATELSSFKNLSSENVLLAIEKLSSFGDKLSDALNDLDIPFIIQNKDFTRSLGALFFVRAAGIFSNQHQENPAASLEIIAIKKQSEFEIKDYLEGKRPEEKDRLIAQRVFNVD